jgi:hypothetical protein
VKAPEGFWTMIGVIASLAVSALTMITTFSGHLEQRLCRIETTLKIGECGR